MFLRHLALTAAGYSLRIVIYSTGRKNLSGIRSCFENGRPIDNSDCAKTNIAAFKISLLLHSLIVRFLTSDSRIRGYGKIHCFSKKVQAANF